MKKVIPFVILSSVLLCCSATAQGTVSKLTVVTGSSSGTYSQLFGQMGRVCTNTSFLLEKKTGGSLDNINALINNEASLGFVQLDILLAKQKLDKDPNVDKLKVLLPLHSEEIHIIASNATAKDGGQLFNKTKAIKTYADLSGKRVGSFGGSVITAKVMSMYTKVNYAVQNFPDANSAIAALQSNKVDAVIAVGGYPLPWVAALNSTLRLLPLDSTSTSRLSGFYQGAKIQYTNLGINSVNTVSVPSVLVTRDFKTADKKQLLLKYASCVKSKLTYLQETEGYHPKWNSVTFSPVKWPSYK